MPVPVLNLITNALIEAEWLAQGEIPNPEDAAFALSKLNDISDTMAAEEKFVSANIFELFTLVPNLSPHTIGPAGNPAPTFPVLYRPVKLVEPAAIVLLNTDGTTTDLPIAVEDAQWWAEVRVKNQTSSIPQAVYFEPDWPLGSLYFWPIPTTNYQVRLQFWTQVAQFASTQTQFSMPPGFREYLTLRLAQKLGGPRTAELTILANQAESSITQNNAQSPRMNTAVAGIPQSNQGGRTDFNFLTGEPW